MCRIWWNERPQEFQECIVADVGSLVGVCLTLVLPNEEDHAADQDQARNQTGPQQEGIEIVHLSGDLSRLRRHERSPGCESFFG
jgi:hypothetical protein